MTDTLPRIILFVSKTKSKYDEMGGKYSKEQP